MISRHIFEAMLFLFPMLLKAQENIDSPASIAGVGDIQLSEGGRTAGMASASLSLSGSYFLNTMNPAGLSGIDSTNLIFDIVTSSRRSEYSYRNLKEKAFSANFTRITAGLRFTKKWSAAVTLKPFSTVSYHIDKYLQEEGADATVKSEYEGSGGITQVVFTNSYKISDNLSVGADFSLLFGSINRTTSISGYLFNQTSEAHTTAFNAGILYKMNLSKDVHLSTALVYGTQSNFIFSNDLKISDGTENIYVKRLASSEANIPGCLGAGISLSGKSLIISADLHLRKKISYDDQITGTRFTGTRMLNMGLGYTPSAYYPSTYFESIQYQAGFSLSNSYLIQNNKNPVNMELTTGAGLPLRNGSQINLSFSWGKRGIQDSKIIKENYFRISLGLSLIERMFVKRLYD
jgi:hypothetical protein